MVNNILDFFNFYKESFTSIGVFITFFISSGSLYFAVRNNKAVHYVNAVTKSRIEWIQELRSIIANFISKTNMYNNAYYTKDSIKAGLHLSECQKLCSEIKLLLNYCDEKDREIIDLSESILSAFAHHYNEIMRIEVDINNFIIENDITKKYSEAVERDIIELSQKVQIYLKAEWNRVKYESQGKIYEKDTQRFDYKELEEKYKNNLYKNRVFVRYFIDLYAKIKRVLSYPKLYIYIIIILVIYLLIR